MAPTEIHDDYYAILDISNTATVEVIKQSYRKLAIKHHPDKNPHRKEAATVEFQFLYTAYETLTDPDKRRLYDYRWPGIRDQAQARKREEERRCHAERAQRETEKAQREREAHEKFEREKGEARKKVREDAKVRDRQHRLEALQKAVRINDGDVFELGRVVRRLETELKGLKVEEDKALREESDRNSWWTYIKTPIYGIPQETDEEKETRERDRLRRLVARTMKEKDLKEQQAKLQDANVSLKDVKDKISALMREKLEEERAEAARRQEETRKRAEELRRKQEADERLRQQKIREKQEAERRAREQEERARREKQEAEERVKKQADEARRQKAFEEWQEAWQKEQVRLKKERDKAEKEFRAQINRESEAHRLRKLAETRARAAKNRAERNRGGPSTPSSSNGASGSANNRRTRSGQGTFRAQDGTCQHKGWWNRVEESGNCSNCGTFRFHYMLQCPTCDIKACPGCRIALQKRGPRRPAPEPAYEDEDTGYRDYY